MLSLNLKASFPLVAGQRPMLNESLSAQYNCKAIRAMND